MAKKRTPSLRDRLRKAGIRHYDELIHDQSQAWLIKKLQPGRRRISRQRGQTYAQHRLADPGTDRQR